MHASNRIYLAIAIVTASVLCGQATANRESDLMVSIESDCAEYGMQDSMTVTVTLKNQSDSSIVLYSKLGWGELGGVTLRVSKMSGEVVHQEYLDDDMIVPSTLRNRDYYSTLFSNQFIGISRTEQVGELFPATGQYKVWAEYLSPVPAASSLIKQKFWSMEKGRLSSSAVVLTVVQGNKCAPL